METDEAPGGWIDTWTYDAIGNRLTSTVDGEPRTYTYFKNGTNPLNGQRLASDGELAYTYDANGNTLTRTGVTFGWDAGDRMTSISGAVTASYAYDDQGRRTGKTVTGATTSYLYDGLNLVRTSSASAADYLFGPGIDEPLAMLRGGSVYYVAVDGLGSVTLLSGALGSVESTYLYDAWGVLREQTGSLANDFGYTAREFAEAGLWFYRARYYQPGIGRFVSEDPIGFEGGINLYAYVHSNPVLDRDPLGLAVHRSSQTAPGPYRRCDSHDRIAFWDEPPIGTQWNTEALRDWEAEFRADCEGFAPRLDQFWERRPNWRPRGVGAFAWTYALGPFMIGIEGGGFSAQAPGIWMVCCIQCDSPATPMPTPKP